MREIKFRGKDLDGVWRHGSLVNDVFFYADTKKGVPYIFDVEDVDYSCLADLEDGEGFYELRPETVGQFTGLTDKNGKEIYEGDILRSPLGNIVAVEFGYKEHIVKHGRPNITDSFACYGWIARNVKKGITDFFDNEFAAGEVIGNIYDNPELIAEDMNIQIKED